MPHSAISLANRPWTVLFSLTESSSRHLDGTSTLTSDCSSCSCGTFGPSCYNLFTSNSSCVTPIEGCRISQSGWWCFFWWAPSSWYIWLIYPRRRWFGQYGQWRHSNSHQELSACHHKTLHFHPVSLKKKSLWIYWVGMVTYSLLSILIHKVLELLQNFC